MNIRVAILAGGRGTRLLPVVPDTQKVVAGVGGRPFLAYLLDRIAAAGIDEAVLLVGHHSAQVRDLLGSLHAGVRLRYSVEESPLGTGGAVRHALPLLDAPTLLVLNGDSYADIDVPRFVHFHRQHALEASIALTEVSDTSRYGRVECDDAGRVRSFAEKAASSGAGLVNAGAYLFERRLFEALPGDTPLSLERDLLPEWVARREVAGRQCVSRFLDIGTPETFSAAAGFLAGQARR